jgi:hypothetical protein
MMNKLTRNMLAAALFAAAPLAAAGAQPAQGQVAVGMQVIGPSDGVVGVIASMNGGNVMLKTDRHSIPMPAGSFTVQEGKAYFGMTREQVNAEYEKAVADAEASVTPGAVVKGLNGVQVGTIQAVDSENVTLKLDTGQVVILPRSGVAGRPDGAIVGLTAEQLAAKVAGN